MGQINRQNSMPSFYGRQIPASKGLNALRAYGKKASQTLLAGVLALASTNISQQDEKEDAQGWQWTGTPQTEQTPHLRVQEKAFEDAYNKLSETVRFEIVTHTLLDYAKVNPRYGNPKALSQYSAPNIMAEIDDSFFILSTNGIAQKTFGEIKEHAERLDKTVNYQALNESTTVGAISLGDRLQAGSPGAARRFGLAAVKGEEAVYISGCSMYSTPFHADLNTLVRQVSGVSNHQLVVDFEAELEDFHQYVDNHELTHCVTSNIRSFDFDPEEPPAWYKESVADLYAAARHFQLHGDDGFAEKIIAMRETAASVSSHTDMRHYTVPVLERALPHLKAAVKNGEQAGGKSELEDLNPRELLEYIGDKVFNNPEEPQVFTNITTEHSLRRMTLFAALQGAQYEKGAPEYDELLNALGVTHENIKEAKEDHIKSRDLIFNKIENPDEAEQVFEQSLRETTEEMLNGLPNIHQAYVAASYKVRHLQKEVEEFQARFGLSEDEVLQSKGASGLNRNRELEIYAEYQHQLEVQIVHQTPEPDQPENTNKPNKTAEEYFPGS